MFLIGVVFVLALTINLESTPPFWWDEGWTLSVARNWVELGHYGRLSLGEKAPPGMEAAFPVTGSIALAFNFIGVGISQGRLVIAIYLIATLLVLFYLGCRFYNRGVAVGALLVLLLMAGNRYMHPAFMGRQVLAEVPALFFLLSGFVCFLWAGERSRIFLLGSILFWSVAIITKAQVLPFWVLSMSVPLAVALLIGRWRVAMMVGGVFLGSALLGYFWQSLIAKVFATSSSVSGLSQAVGLVFDPFRRFVTILTTLQIGLPTLLGLVWALRSLEYGKNFGPHAGIVMLAYFVLVGSWFGWWALASTGWPRYLFPAAFLSSIFVSAMLYEWTDGFRIGACLRNAARSLGRFNVEWREVRVIGALLLVGWSSLQTVKDLGDAFIGKTNQPLFETVSYLNSRTPPSSVIESYESELFLFLDRPYHYPPDQTPVELIRREDLGEPRVIDYDPLSADPDYLVVGGWCRYYKCYDSVLSNGAFRLTNTFGPYRIYERIRSASRPFNDSTIPGS